MTPASGVLDGTSEGGETPVSPPTVRILTLLPDDSLSALRAALESSDTTVPVRDAATLLSAAGTVPADAIVVDPSGLSDAEWAGVKPMLSAGIVPVLLYAALAPQTVRRVIEASGAGVHEVLLRHVDDDPRAIRRRLETLDAPPPPARLLSRISARLATLPPSLQATAVPLFCAGPVPRWVDGMAGTAGVARRSMDRWMSRSGLSGTAALLDVARLARVWDPLVVQAADPADVAARHGYGRQKMLSVHLQRIVGASVKTLGNGVTVTQFVDRLARHVARR